MSKILLIDDDEGLAPPLRSYFERFGLTLSNATRPSEGLNLLAQERPEARGVEERPGPDDVIVGSRAQLLHHVGEDVDRVRRDDRSTGGL